MSAAAERVRAAMGAAERQLRIARSVVVTMSPFYGALLLNQKVVEDPTTETIATDGKNLYFNPEFIAKCSTTDLHFICAHEAFHPGLLHHLRRGDRDEKVWNEACDYAINPILIQAKFHMPKGGLFRQDFVGMSAEKIYAKLMEERRAQKRSDAAGGQEPKQGGQEAGQGAGNGSDPQAQPGKGQKPTYAKPDCGGCGCVLDGPKDPGERAAQESEWKQMVAKAASLAGTLPGELQQAVDAILKPRADWRDLLHRFMDQFARDDSSWESPNRRFVAEGIYLPSMRSRALAKIAFVIDASLSMPRRSLDQAMSEVQVIVSDLRPEGLEVIVHDTEVRTSRVFEPDEDCRDFSVTARGGTIFRTTCDFINDQPDDYACVIWFTDMDPADWEAAAEVAPSCPVLWIDYGDTTRQPSFGDEVIRMPVEEEAQ